jgi:hypothetical protein
VRRTEGQVGKEGAACAHLLLVPDIGDGVVDKPVADTDRSRRAACRRTDAMSDVTAALRRDFSRAAAFRAAALSVMLTETQAIAGLDKSRASILSKFMEI